MQIKVLTTHRSCIIVLLTTAASVLIALLMFSYCMDPFALFHRSDYIPPLPANTARPSLSSYSYITKAKRIAEEKPDRILLGSSIVDNAFRLPGSTAFWYNPYPEPEARLIARSGPKAITYFNAAIRNGGMGAMWDYLQFAYRQNPKLNSVILGTEYTMLNPWACKPTLPRISLLDQSRVPFSFTMEYLISPLALRSAYEVFYASSLAANLHRFMPSPETLRFPVPLSNWENCPPSPEPDRSDTRFSPSSAEVIAPEGKSDFDRFIMAVWLVNRVRYNSLSAMGVALHQQSLEDYRHFVDFCRSHRIDLQVYRSPQPAVFWVLLEHFGQHKSVERWYKELTDATPIWDFGASIDFSPKANELFPSDPLHFSPDGGEIILSAILKGQQENAWYVSASKQREADLRRSAMIEEWKEKHRGEWRAIASFSPITMGDDPQMFTTDLSTLKPVLLDPSYRGYQIIRVLGHYIGIPVANHLPVDGYKLLGGDYPGTLRGRTLHEMVSSIDMRFSSK